MTQLHVLSCGPMTSPQDAGRIGFARQGLSRSGAMDRDALAMANALVGNRPDEAALELMLIGGTFRVEGGECAVALAGAAMPAGIDGRPLPPLTTAILTPGETLTIGIATAGVFAYLAVGGGLAVEPMLGSVSLQARAGIGGIGGRSVRAGDAVALRAPRQGILPGTRLDDVAHAAGEPIRVVLGPQDDHFPAEAISAFLSNRYEVSNEADRMGYRLVGPAIAHLAGFNIVSDGIVAGSIQVPGSGVPIVLMADHQTTGGYPKIATVISADLGRLAQRRPGTEMRFAAVTVAEAHRLLRERAAWVADLPARLRPAARGAPDADVLMSANLAGAAVDALAAP